MLPADRLRYRTLAALSAAVAIVVLIALAGALRAAPAAPVALSGRVSSAAEGLMEGVVVTARRPGSPISVSVVTDAQGRYR
ncbi:MAG: hypothetical protein ABSH03_23950, partial [Candidatus Lustribacter sp.]